MHDLTFNLVVLIRITASILFGFGLGLERELTNKYAGLRTHILVCLGACVFTILSVYAFPAAVYGSHGDPARIAAQIITGIGFIGGGTVLRHGSSVYGLTTAATLWVAAAIGMSCGAGMLWIGFFTSLISIIVLVLIRMFERDVLVNTTKNTKRIKITVFCKEKNVANIHNYIIENFEHMHEISKEQENGANNLTKIVATVDFGSKKPIQSLYRKFQNLIGIESILIQENDE